MDCKHLIESNYHLAASSSAVSADGFFLGWLVDSSFFFIQSVHISSPKKQKIWNKVPVDKEKYYGTWNRKLVHENVSGVLCTRCMRTFWWAVILAESACHTPSGFWFVRWSWKTRSTFRLWQDKPILLAGSHPTTDLLADPCLSGLLTVEMDLHQGFTTRPKSLTGLTLQISRFQCSDGEFWNLPCDGSKGGSSARSSKAPVFPCSRSSRSCWSCYRCKVDWVVSAVLRNLRNLRNDVTWIKYPL